MFGSPVQVSKNFSDVFRELVPNGKGQLVMKRAEDVLAVSSDSSLTHPLVIMILPAYTI